MGDLNEKKDSEVVDITIDETEEKKPVSPLLYLEPCFQ